jgi:hypothetical protein
VFHDTNKSSLPIARLTYLDPRLLWPHEALNLTPWLLENADLLGEALGLDLTLTVAEHPVGGFSLDLLGEDQVHHCPLAVENQLGATDHDHLGKLLTYAAGTDAKTLVWLATIFREEHRQAVEWVNRSTHEDVRLFGIELKAVQIGDSAAAPLLDVVAQPSDWQKHLKSVATSSGVVSAKQALYYQFWDRLLQRVHADHPQWTHSQTPNKDNWLGMPSPIPGTTLCFVFPAGHRLSAELYLQLPGPDQNLALFHQLAELRPQLEAFFGDKLTFDDLPKAKGCRIARYMSGDITETDQHDGYINWFIDSGVRWRQALGSIRPHLGAETELAPGTVSSTPLAGQP